MPRETLLDRLNHLGKRLAPAVAATTVLLSPTAKAQDAHSNQELAWMNSSSELSQWFYQEPVRNGFRQTPIDKIDEKVLKNGKLDLIKNGWNQTLLTAAVMNGKIRTVDLLLNAGASPDKKNGLNQYPLFLAIQAAKRANNHTGLSVIQSLLKAGAQLNITDENGQTPLMMAAKNGQTQIMDLLISAGADKNMKDKAGKTAADLYAQHQQALHPLLVKQLKGIEK